MKTKIFVITGMSISCLFLLSACCTTGSGECHSYGYEYQTSCGKQSCTDQESLDLTPPPAEAVSMEPVSCVSVSRCGVYRGQG